MATRDEKKLYRLTYRVDGKVCFAEMYAKGERLRTLLVPSKAAHTFLGWQDLPERMPGENLTIDGSFVPMSFALVFRVDGVEISREEVVYGSPIAAPSVPPRDGYEFSGWENLPETMPGEDLTIDGKYLKDRYRLTYVIDGRHRFLFDLPFGAPIEPMEHPVKDEHVFSGWQGLPETMPAEDVTVEGSFSLKTFRLTRIVDGEVFMEENLKIGDKIDKKVKPIKPGFYFSGWRKLPDTMPDHDITAITSMYPVRYRVDFEIDGEAWRTTYIPYTSPFVCEETPEEREGYRFSGWTDAPEIMPMQDIVVHGSYIAEEVEETVPVAPSYTVRVTLLGEVISETIYAEGDAIVMPEAPVREGYTFVGYGDVPELMPAGDLTFEAGYTANEYTLTVRVDGETVSEEKIACGDALAAPEMPVREGYTFTGFGDVPETMPAHDLILEGSYSAGDYKLTVRVDGEIISEAPVACGAAIVLPETPEREGYTFSGFGDVPAVMPAFDLTLDGSYAVNEYTLTVSVDGEVISEGKLAFGSEIAMPEMPEREGYAFSGFGDVPAVMPASDLALEGCYTQLEYRIAYLLDGETVAEESLPFGAPVFAPEAPAREGYSFAGWEGLPETMPASETFVTGSYTAELYRVTFSVDGVVLSEESLPFGAVLTVPETEERLGFTFSGFGEIPATMPASALAFTGSYSANSYALRFVLDGETVFSTELAFGAPVFAPTPEIPAHMSFSGWESLPETMPASDLTVAGSLTELLYPLSATIEGEVVYEAMLPYGATFELPEAPVREGYVFAWACARGVMGDSALSIEGVYTAILYTLTFSVDGETVAEYRMAAGEAITVPAVGEREGYTFLGFSDVPEAMPACDTVIIGARKEIVPEVAETVEVPEEVLYRVSYTADGELLAEGEMPEGAALIVPEVPAREGYGFAWENLPDAMPASDLAVVGFYTANVHTVTFLLAGEVFGTAELAFGEELLLPEVPAREGCSFAWGEAPERMGDEDLTVEGVYTEEVFLFTVTVDGEETVRIELPFGAELPALSTPAKIGHTFSGFGEIPETMPASDLALSGSFTCNSYRLTVVLGGEVVRDENVLFGEEIAMPEAPAREGHTFSGWGDVPATMPPYDFRVVSDYTPNTYRVRFVCNGETVSDTEVSFGSRIFAPSMPEPEGYVFSGYGEIPETMGACDLVFESTLTPITYHVTFLLNGESILEADVAYGEAIPVPEIEETEGYSFSGFEIPEGGITEDTVLEATRTAKAYRLVFMLDGEEFSRSEVLFGSAITAPEVPARENALFSGWNQLPETMPAHDLCVAGSYTETLYKLTFAVEGAVIAEYALAAGDAVTAPEAPARYGLLFEGWENLPETMPGKDLVCMGIYVPAVYRVTFLLDGASYAEYALAVGDAIPVPALEEREGFILSQFCDVPAVMPAEDLLFTASYTEIPCEIEIEITEEPAVEEEPAPVSFRLAFVLGGEVVFETVEEAGNPILLPAVALLDEEDIVTWQELPETMPACDTEIVGTVSRRTYTLTFLSNGKNVASFTLAKGEAIALPEAPLSDTPFLYWDPVLSVMPGEDTVINAVYETPGEHTVRFMIDDTLYAEATGLPGAEIVLPEDPSDDVRTLVEWVGVPACMPAGDLTVYAVFRPTTFRVSFLLDGEIFRENEYVAGSVVVAPPVPPKEGHTFAGWHNLTEEMPPYDFTVSGSYEANMHDVVYLVDGKTVAAERVPFGAKLTAPEAPVLPDATFRAWVDLPDTMPDCDLTVEADYDRPEFTVTYRIDGSVYHTTRVAVGRIVPKPNAPKKAGLTFDGWRNYTRVMPPYDIILDGGYSASIHTVTYVADDIVIARRNYAVGESVVEIDGRNPALGIFDGWLNMPAIMPDHDVTVTAKYLPRELTITYLLDEKPVAKQTAYRGEPILPPLAPERDGYNFAGWQNLPAVMPGQDLIVRGLYEAAFHTITYRADGRIYHREVYPIDGAIRAMAAPHKPGYRFVGWRNFSATMPDYDFTVDATYEPIVRHYSFVANGVTLLEGDMQEGEVLLAPEAPSVSGYDFIEYPGYTGAMPGEDVVYEAKYDLHNYSIFFIIEGDIRATVLCHAGDAITEEMMHDPELPEGYRFTGWSPAPAVMPDRDIEILGAIEPMPFRLTMTADGHTVFSDSVICDRPIPKRAAPERHGYSFVGWEALPELMPARDVTVDGRYEACEPRYEVLKVFGKSQFSKANRTIYLPEKSRKRVKRGLYSNTVYVSGDRVELTSRGECYTLDISAYVAGGIIVDEAGLVAALRHLSRAAKRANAPYHLVFDHPASVNRILDIVSVDETEIAEMVQDRMQPDFEQLENPTLYYNVLAVNREESLTQVIASVVDAGYFRKMRELLSAAGIMGNTPVTPVMGMLEYMQSRDIQDNTNSLVFVHTGGYLMLGLYVNGRIAFVSKNAVSFDLSGADEQAELTRQLAMLEQYLEEENHAIMIRELFYAGFRYRGAKRLIKFLRNRIRRINKSPRAGFKRHFTRKKPARAEIPYPYLKHCIFPKKVKTIDPTNGRMTKQ